MNLSELNAEILQELVGQQFKIGSTRLELLSIDQRFENQKNFRNSFSLFFDAPKDLVQFSKVIPVSHPKIGTHELLVSQVFDADRGSVLEICFA